MEVAEVISVAYIRLESQRKNPLNEDYPNVLYERWMHIDPPHHVWLAMCALLPLQLIISRTSY